MLTALRLPRRQLDTNLAAGEPIEKHPDPYADE